MFRVTNLKVFFSPLPQTVKPSQILHCRCTIPTLWNHTWEPPQKIKHSLFFFFFLKLWWIWCKMYSHPRMGKNVKSWPNYAHRQVRMWIHAMESCTPVEYFLTNNFSDSQMCKICPRLHIFWYRCVNVFCTIFTAAKCNKISFSSFVICRIGFPAAMKNLRRCDCCVAFVVGKKKRKKKKWVRP